MLYLYADGSQVPNNAAVKVDHYVLTFTIQCSTPSTFKSLRETIQGRYEIRSMADLSHFAFRVEIRTMILLSVETLHDYLAGKGIDCNVIDDRQVCICQR